MFKISTKGDYGLIFLSALAEFKDEGFVSLRAIAKEKKLSMQYLSQIVIPLKDAGIVESKEGFNGGYRLAKNPEDINLMEILEILEGGVDILPCCDRSKNERLCGREAECNLKGVWNDASNLMRSFLKNKTLADTVRKSSREINVSIIK